MIKECPVLKYNDVVTVVRFGDIDVQLPSMKNPVNIVRVAFENGKYFVVDDNYEQKSSEVKLKKNKVAKKATPEKNLVDPNFVCEEITYQ